MLLISLPYTEERNQWQGGSYIYNAGEEKNKSNKYTVIFIELVKWINVVLGSTFLRVGCWGTGKSLHQYPKSGPFVYMTLNLGAPHPLLPIFPHNRF